MEKEAVYLKSYRDLEVWQRAMDLVVECYRMTNHFPTNETYGLTIQMQRAAVSVPANIAGSSEILAEFSTVGAQFIAPSLDMIHEGRDESRPYR